MASAEGMLVDPAVFAMLSSACNNELKAATLAVLDDVGTTTAHQLQVNINGLQGESPVWSVTAGNLQPYCGTLAVGGLVKVESSWPELYTRTPTGERALPMIGHLYDLSLSEAPPLYAYFGKSGRRNGEGPWTSERRIGMMRAAQAAEGKKVSMTTAAEEVNSSISAAATVADDLVLYGLISISGTGRTEQSVKYQTTDNILASVTHTQFGRDLISILVNFHQDSSIRQFSSRDIISRLVDLGYVDDQALAMRVSSRVGQLADKYGSIRTSRIHGERGVRSVIWATDDQARTIESLFKALGREYSDMDAYVTQGIESLNLILSDTELVRHLFGKAKAAAAGRKKLPEAQDLSNSTLCDILRDFKEPLTTRELWDLMQFEGILLDLGTVSDKLDHLVKSGQAIIVPSRGSTVMYAWHEPED